MAQLLMGAGAAAELCAPLAERSRKLADWGAAPCLAIVRVGARQDDLAYESAAVRRCGVCGVTARRIALPADIPPRRLLRELSALNADEGVHGILLLRPLPFDDTAACAALAPEKDVDGLTPASMASLYAGTGPGFAPCTAEACVALLRHYNIPIAGRRVTVVGRSLVIGKPAAMLLLRENATVTVAHSRTEHLAEVCREADILIVAAGREGLIGAEHVRAGQTVLDVGIHTAPDGTLRGDVRFREAEPIVAALTPVPGGVGALTTALLCRHTVDSCFRAAGGI